MESSEYNVSSATERRHGFEIFRKDLLRHIRNVSYSTLITGSVVELKVKPDTLPISLTEDGEHLTSKTDVDYMHYCRDMCVMPKGKLRPDGFAGRIYRIESMGLHPGYARLVRKHGRIQLNHTDLLNISGISLPEKANSFREGPAVTASARPVEQQEWDQIKAQWSNQCNRSALAESGFRAHLGDILEYADHVGCVVCPCWPDEALEWKSRIRPSGVPSNDLIREIVGAGCHFVAVSYKGICDNEFRFSFSKAEIKLIHSWSRCQLLMYRALRMLKTTINIVCKQVMPGYKSVICSYHAKTLMLWACEQKCAEFWLWNDNQIEFAFNELISQLIDWLQKRNCPNYFIPSNNMLDHLASVQCACLDQEISIMQLLTNGEQSIISELLSIKEHGSLDFTTSYHLHLPKKIWNIVAFKSILYDNTIANNLENHQVKSLDEIVSEELSCLYNGIKLQLKYADSVNLSPASKTDCLLLAAEEQLKQSVSLEKVSGTACVDISITDHCFDELTSWLPLRIRTEKSDLADVSISREDAKFPQDSEYALTECVAYAYTKRNSFQADRNVPTCEGFCSYGTDNPKYTWYATEGVSPTVNLTWFMSSAYLANFYYTTKNDYQLAISLCNEIIETCNLSLKNHRLAADGFPFLLCTQQCGIYDTEIQTLLGFTSLFTFIASSVRKGTTVYAGVCPIDFVSYIKYRCTLLTGFEAEHLIGFFNKTESHTCNGDKNVYNGKKILGAAWEIVGRHFKRGVDKVSKLLERNPAELMRLINLIRNSGPIKTK